MARRPDPERIATARHNATRNRLISDGMQDSTADAWLSAWADEAERQGLERLTSAYWDAADSWIAEQRRTRRMPP